MNDDDDRGVLVLAGLPMAMREELGPRVDLKKTLLGSGKRETAGNERGGHGHGVAAAK